MAAVKDIYAFLDKKAPFSFQMSFDNAGFLVGRGGQAVGRLLISLDITEEVADEARDLDCGLIVSHHPVIFHPAKSVTDETPTGRTLLALAENHIAAICAHTNLDVAAGGVNDALALALGLTEIGPLGADGIGRVGAVEGERTTADFAAFVKTALCANGARFVDAGRPVRRVAVGGGACADMLPDALKKGCDTFVTSDVKYNGFLDARDLGVNLIDAGHYPTENVVCPVLARWLREAFPDVEVLISARHREVFSYL